MEEKQIALLIETSTSWGTDIVKGVADYARDHANWYFHIEPRGKFEHLKLPKNWHGDGIIARVTYEGLAQAIIESECPAVNVSWYTFGSEHIPICTTDVQAAGEMIAQYFLGRGFRSFGYCGPVNRPAYVDRFGAAYVHALREAGHECARFLEQAGEPDSAIDWEDRTARLRAWVVDLPKPAAVLAFSDVGGRRVAEACRKENLAVPEEIALIGGEHDDLACEITRPPLSSIDLAPHRIGWEAAKLLDGLMSGEAPPGEAVRIPPARILSRLSTDTLAVDDLVVADAMRFIEENIGNPISVSDVLRVIPLSRRVLEQRFKKYFSRSPADVIRRLRIERGKTLLAETEHPMSRIATECGFEHSEVFARVFHRQVGVTPTAYRNQLRSN